ncbi:prepilin-type N-terminal cleavage/methylation domain-containing protein [Thiobacter aerophilum]|uniref:Prepilin-type N-terminal cleavage/methylation domain-containing protein n=1 Tax=Thiobacter aerophilum TaxID=3121275 RepID=A0ABV0EH24_9BURK
MNRARGFTLIEMIVVIVITGIIAAMVAVFLRKPVEGYFDTARRAQLSDIADTALRRMARDVRLALPNTLRVTDGDRTVEFLLTRTGARYRAQPRSDGTGDPLDISTLDTGFDILGPPITFQNGDRIAVYNLGPNIPGANAYVGDTLSAYTGPPGAQSHVSIAAKQFPLASPASRFQVVEGPVSYACDLTSGTLWRYWGYAIQATQPNAASLPSLAGVQAARLATLVTGCSFRYLEGVTERSGVLELSLTLSDGGENVTLYHTVHVDNEP